MKVLKSIIAIAILVLVTMFLFNTAFLPPTMQILVLEKLMNHKVSTFLLFAPVSSLISLNTISMMKGITNEIENLFTPYSVLTRPIDIPGGL